MKTLLAGVLLALGLTLGGGIATAPKAEAQFASPCAGQTGAALTACQSAYFQGARRGYRRGSRNGEVVVAPSTGIDVNTLLLMQALGGGATGGAALLPFLLQGQTQTQTVIRR